MCILNILDKVSHYFKLFGNVNVSDYNQYSCLCMANSFKGSFLVIFWHLFHFRKKVQAEHPLVIKVRQLRHNLLEVFLFPSIFFLQLQSTQKIQHSRKVMDDRIKPHHQGVTYPLCKSGYLEEIHGIILGNIVLGFSFR